MRKLIFVPVGINCAPTHFLGANRLRKGAYPFDWNVTPLSSMIELIENDFHDYLRLENLEFLPPTRRMLFKERGVGLKASDELITPVICRRYNILFPHDFSEAGIDDYEEVRNKYLRRIERFKKCVSEHDVRLVYHIKDLNDWQKEQYDSCEAVFTDITGRQFGDLNQGLVESGYHFVALDDLKTQQFLNLKKRN